MGMLLLFVCLTVGRGHAEGFDESLPFQSSVELDSNYQMPPWTDRLSLIKQIMPDGRVFYHTGLRIALNDRSIYAVIRSLDPETDVRNFVLNCDAVDVVQDTKQTSRVAYGIGSSQNEVLFVQVENVLRPRSDPIDFRYAPADERIAKSTLISYVVNESKPTQHKLQAYRVTLSQRQRPDWFDATPGTGGILVDDDGIPWGILPSRAGISSTVFRAQIYPLPDIHRDLKPSTKRLELIHSRRRPNSIKVKAVVTDPINSAIGHTVHVGRPRNVQVDFASNRSRLKKVATNMLPFRCNPEWSSYTDSFLTTGKPIQRDEGFVLQIEFHHLDGSSTFDRPFYCPDIAGEAKHIPVTALLERHSKAANSSLNPIWCDPLEPTTDNMQRQIGEPMTRGELSGIHLELGDPRGIQKLVWSSDSRFVFGLCKERSVIKVEIETGLVVAQANLPEMIMDLDVSRRGVVVLAQQQVFLLNEESLRVSRSVSVPAAAAIAAATGSDRVFATSGSRLFEVFSEPHEVVLMDHLASPRPAFQIRTIDDLEVTEDGSALLICDQNRIHRYRVTSDSVVWEEATENIKQLRSELLYAQGGHHVTVITTTTSPVKNTYASLPNYPTEGLYIYDYRNLKKPQYCIRNLHRIALHPKTGGYLGYLYPLRGSARLIFGDDRGAEVHSMPGKPFRDVREFKWSPNGKFLYAHLGRGAVFELPRKLQEEATYVAQEQEIVSNSLHSPLQVESYELDRWNMTRLPWSMPSIRDAQTWSEDGESLYVITYPNVGPQVRRSQVLNDGLPKYGLTVRKLKMPDLVEEHSTTFPEPIDFIGQSAEGLVVRYMHRQAVALLDSRTLQWKQDVGIPNPVGLTTSPKLSNVWIARIYDRFRPAIGSLHEFELPSGRLRHTYESQDLCELLKPASPDIIPERYLLQGCSHGAPFQARLSPNGHSLFTNAFGICRFDFNDGKLIYGDCTGPAQTFSSDRKLFVSHNSKLVGCEGLNRSARSKMHPKYTGGSLVFDANDLSSVLIDASARLGPRGLAVDTFSNTAYCTSNGYKVLAMKAGNSDTEVIDGFGSTASYDTSITASPRGDGFFLVYGNQAMWFVRKDNADEN